MTKKKKNVREIAFKILESVSKNQSYSNLQLNDAIRTNDLSSRDAALLTEITYGTIQRQLTLDFYLQPFLKRKIEDWVRQLLRLTVYQLVFLNKIPDHAAIFEAVEIAKKRGHKGIASLVNGVLRSAQRHGFPTTESIKDPIEKLAVETSHPKWIVEKWIDDYGIEKTTEICIENLQAPVQTARINKTKTTREACLKLLRKEGFLVEESSLLQDGIRCLKGNIAHSTCYQEGLFSIQDESSMLVGYAVDPQQDENILDACAAPGGKSTHLAERLVQTGKVISLDLHEHKVKLIENQANRLGLMNIETKVLDSRQALQHFPAHSFDRILLDAPCSGLGVIRRKPDIKYTKNPTDLLKLKDIQLALLNGVAPLLKKNGLLVYSTCTVNKQENDEVITTFLTKNKQFELDPEWKNRMPEIVQPFIKDHKLQILPQDFGSDGFFITCLRKKV